MSKVIKNIEILTENENLLVDLFGHEPVLLEKTSFDEIDLEFKSKSNVGAGFNLNELIVGISIGIISGVPAGIIANVIYDKLMQNGENKIVIKEDRTTIVNKEDLTIYIKEVITKEEQNK